MTIALFVIAALVILSALLTIGAVGKPRKPLEPGTAVGATLIYAAEAVVIVIAALHR